jgi:hypothetical protein
MPFHALSDDERRSYCRREIEALELWLRRLVHETFSAAYGAAYLDATGPDGNRLFKSETARQVAARRTADPARYPRPVDATHLDDLVNVICKPESYKGHFRSALQSAFPQGAEEARTFLDRIVTTRHKLSHATPITAHDAARVICYTQDVVGSLKEHYAAMNIEREYNVPMIIKVVDSYGNVFHAAEIKRNRTGTGTCRLDDRVSGQLRPGNRLSLEIEVDPTFERTSYQVSWIWKGNSSKKFVNVDHVIINIEKIHVNPQFLIHCFVTSNRDWHRLGDYDDSVTMVYMVLPPLS